MGCSSCGQRYKGNALTRARTRGVKPPASNVNAPKPGITNQGVTPPVSKQGEAAT